MSPAILYVKAVYTLDLYVCARPWGIAMVVFLYSQESIHIQFKCLQTHMNERCVYQPIYCSSASEHVCE